MTIKHSFVSAISDGADATLVRPSNWNADHVLDGTSLQIQFNNAGSLTGMSGTSWDDANRSLTLTGASVTASNPVLNLTQTWNNASVAFSAISLNITNTACAALSKVIDIKAGSNPVFQVQTDFVGGSGTIVFGGGNGSTTTLGSSNGFGLQISSSGLLTNSVISGSGLFLVTTGSVNWSSDASNTGFVDISLFRDAAGILGQRNGLNPQTLRIYNTTDNGSNYERAFLDWNGTANTFVIGVQSSGSGLHRAVKITSEGASPANLIFNPAGLADFNGSSVSGINNLTVSNGIVTITTGGLYRGDFSGGLQIASSGVTQFQDSSLTGQTGWFQWGGQKRVTSDVTFTSTTTMANVTGLSVNVAAGRTYSYEAFLSFTDAPAGGIRAGMSGTATATALEQCGWVFDSSGVSPTYGRSASFGAVVAQATTGAAGGVQLKGTITVNAAGTLTVQAAQGVSNATATTIKRGSYFIVYDMP